ncbi:toll/interleukin-1 receptor domain-containing protein [Nitrosovibrio tenuis]|uniref:TIR domain-containing protein n=1 Tax=Nitrosovibrio tenuis TaxID=1233 RepID=UPI000B894170
MSQASVVPIPNQPLVFISYNLADSAFQEKLNSLLSREPGFNRISMSEHPDIEGNKEPGPLFRPVIERANVAVLLISPQYLTSHFSSLEALALVEQRARRDLRLFPILLRPCSWREVKWLSETQVFPLDGEPISAHMEEEQESLWALAARHRSNCLRK